jgi:outer membrane protein assembly factor BamB
LSSEAVSPASTDDARVFVQTVDGRTSAFERADGKQAWSYQTAAPVLTVRGTGAPLVLEQLVVTGFATGKVVALDKALGIPRWNVRLASPDGRSELERLVDVDGAPIWDNGILYAAAYHGKIAAISQMGDTIWEEDGSSYTSPELALGSLYLTLEDDSIQSYDMMNGAKSWKQAGLSGRELGQVTAIGTQLAVADTEGYVHTMSQVDGHMTGRILLRPRPLHMSLPNQGEATNWRALRGKHFGIRSTLVATDAGLLVYTNTGELLLLNVES